MVTRRDMKTPDLFKWEPPTVNAAFPKACIRGADIAAQICQAMKIALSESNLSREVIAAKMTDYLGEEVSHTILDAYVSQAKEHHNISLTRYAALVHATGDMRLLSLIPKLFNYAVIPEKYMGAVNEAITTDKIETLKKQNVANRRMWKAQTHD